MIGCYTHPAIHFYFISYNVSIISPIFPFALYLHHFTHPYSKCLFGYIKVQFETNLSTEWCYVHKRGNVILSGPENNRIKPSFHYHFLFYKWVTSFPLNPLNSGARVLKARPFQITAQTVACYRWRLSAACVNVITLPVPYIFISTALGGTEGNSPQFDGNTQVTASM